MAQTKRERIHATQKKYREANREKLSAYAKAYRKDNVEKIRAINTDYRIANREKITARINAHCKESSKNISDAYVRKILSVNSILSCKDIPPGMIALKREELKIRRLAKELR